MSPEKPITIAFPPLHEIVSEAIQRFNSQESWLDDNQEEQPYFIFLAAEEVVDKLIQSGMNPQDILTNLARQTRLSLEEFVQLDTFQSAYDSTEELMLAMSEGIICHEMIRTDPLITTKEDDRMSRYYNI